jgi:gas vesicle protein
MDVPNARMEMIDQHGHEGHPLAIGFLTGAAVGVGLGMILAPKKGAEMRRQIATQTNRMTSTASKGYHRASDTVGRYATRGQAAYAGCRDKIGHGARETRRYLSEVADAVTMKSHRLAQMPDKVAAPLPRSSQMAGTRDSAGPQHQPPQNLSVV